MKADEIALKSALSADAIREHTKRRLQIQRQRREREQLKEEDASNNNVFEYMQIN